MRTAMATVHKQFRENKPKPSDSNPTWRRDEKYFKQPAEPAAPLGTPTFAPAWYPHGSPVRIEPSSYICTILTGLQSALPTTSATLTGEKRESSLRFLDEMAETNALISGIMSVIHREQFQIGVRTHEALESAMPELRDVLNHWPSCFTALQVINNRVSPLHADDGSSYAAFDVVASIGDYTGGRLVFPTAPVDFQQAPGSVLAFCGHMLPHTVQKYEGDRISFAWFVKDRVCASAGAPRVSWSTQDRVKDALGMCD